MSTTEIPPTDELVTTDESPAGSVLTGTRSHSPTPSDEAMGAAIVKGTLIGVPVLFLVFFVIDMIAGLSVPLAALGAIIPATIFGAFIGAAVFIGRASDAAHALAEHDGGQD